MPPWAVPIQLFLAAGWGRAATEKLIDPNWRTGRSLDDFLDSHRSQMLPFFRWLVDAFISDISVTVAGVVMLMQFGIAGCLIANRFIRPALWCGIILNVVFTLAGQVNPSAFYLVMELVLLIGLGRQVSMSAATRYALSWSMAAAFLAPFAKTLHPAQVHEDPALMLAFVSVLAAVTLIASASDAQVNRQTEVAEARSPSPRD